MCANILRSQKDLKISAKKKKRNKKSYRSYITQWLCELRQLERPLQFAKDIARQQALHERGMGRTLLLLAQDKLINLSLPELAAGAKIGESVNLLVGRQWPDWSLCCPHSRLLVTTGSQTLTCVLSYTHLLLEDNFPDHLQPILLAIALPE